ncbi:GxxExxY protein [Planctomycetales bacterium ZRK34]|nr:GxxExxY protein [Planctomycetales bacterium ZRK34]
MRRQTAEDAESAEAYQRVNQLTKNIIGAAIRVHRELGPGLLESAYEAALAYELSDQGLTVVRQKPVPVMYRGQDVGDGYRIDLLVDNQVIVELKTVDRLAPIHEAQLLSYLKLADRRVGLLINFHVNRLTDGVKRMVNHL